MDISSDTNLQKIGTCMCHTEQLKKLQILQYSRTITIFKQTILDHRRLDIILLTKGINNRPIIDISIPNGTNIEKKVIEKNTNYSDLR